MIFFFYLVRQVAEARLIGINNHQISLHQLMGIELFERCFFFQTKTIYSSHVDMLTLNTIYISLN